MKRLTCILSALLFLLFSNNITAFAVPSSEDTVIYLENGYYIVETITEESILFRAGGTKSGQKSTTCYNDSNEILWSATLKGTFTHTGSRATCTASSITYAVYDDSWKIISATASKSGNTATGNVVAKKYVLGRPIKTVERTVTLTCSSNGTLS